MDYGTGAIFDVWDMIKETLILQKYELEIIKVVSDGNRNSLSEAYTGSGKMINSDF